MCASPGQKRAAAGLNDLDEVTCGEDLAIHGSQREETVLCSFFEGRSDLSGR